MNRLELEQLFAETLRSADPREEQFDHLAQAIVEIYDSGDVHFKQHIKNRFGRVTDSTGQSFDADNFDLAMARAFIADEIGFTSWSELIASIQNPAERRYPILFQYAVSALWRGDFTSLENTIGGPRAFDDQIKNWFEAGYFTDQPETFAECFAAACWLGREKTVEYLLDKGVDPYAGMRTGLSGFHWAASSGRLNVIKLLIDRKLPMEIENMYGGTVFGQAIWSAVNEHTPDHAAIVEALIDAGAVVEPGYLEWWNEQAVPSEDTTRKVADVLRKHS